MTKISKVLNMTKMLKVLNITMRKEGDQSRRSSYYSPRLHQVRIRHELFTVLNPSQ